MTTATDVGTPLQRNKSQETIRVLNFVGLVLALLITLAVYWYEFSKQSLPCTLCLLQRIAMIGVAFGAALNLKLGPKLRQLGRVWAERLPQRRGLELVAVLSATIRRGTS